MKSTKHNKSMLHQPLRGLDSFATRLRRSTKLPQMQALEGIMESVPYKLSEGLYLEGSGQVLPWFKSLHQITKMGGKPLPEKGKTNQLFWEQETIFDDLVVSIQAMQQGNGIFFLHLKNQVRTDSAQIEYEEVKCALLSKFGSPTEVGEKNGYPYTRWFWGNICLSLTIAERFMDYVSLSVSNGVIKNAL